MDEEKENPLVMERKWISKEEAKKIFPDNEETHEDRINRMANDPVIQNILNKKLHCNV